MKTVVLVGLRLGEPTRDRNWEFNRSRWESWGYSIVEGHHDDDGPYSPSVAKNRAATLAGDWDVAVFVDADPFAATRDQVEVAIQRATSRRQLAFAHDHLTLLTEDDSDHVREHGTLPGHDLGVRHPNTFSSVLAVPRSLWEAVGGFDERFVGWGWEDLAFWAACSAIGGGFHRVQGDIYHLWHPRSWEANEGGPHHPANQVLGERYLAAKTNARATQAIIAERP